MKVLKLGVCEEVTVDNRLLCIFWSACSQTCSSSMLRVRYFEIVSFDEK